MDNLFRRDFVRGAAFSALSYSRIQGANERVGLALIGVGNRGSQVQDAFLEHGDCQAVAVCDLNEDYIDFAVRKSRAQPTRYKDYRKALENRDVDAVVIATPDHWHALMTIDSCRAGKDVYVEKPLCLTVREGRKMVETATETRRVVQVGIQRRSSRGLQEAAEFVRSGGIGPVTVARSFHIQNEWPLGIGAAPDGPSPDEEKWERWLGPAPQMPYNRNRMSYNSRWFFHYSGGQLTNFGVHHIDMLRWCLGQESPRAVTAIGGRYAGIQDNREIPDTLEVLWQYDGPTLVIFSQYNANGAGANPNGAEMELRGTKGTLYIFWDRWEVVPEMVASRPFGSLTPLDRTVSPAYQRSKKAVMEPRTTKVSMDTAPHARNFLDCIKSRAKCNCDVLTGHISTTAPLIANIALKTRSFLEWDARAERFTNNPEANRFLQYEYRAPYKLA